MYRHLFRRRLVALLAWVIFLVIAPQLQAQCVNWSIPPGTSPFSEIIYVSAPNASGDLLVVGTRNSAFDSWMSSIPPGNGTQQFCQPVPILPDLQMSAYVPTTAERSGNFPAFAGLLLDTNVQPLPGGVVPSSLWQEWNVWRIPAFDGVVSPLRLTFNHTTGFATPPQTVQVRFDSSSGPFPLSFDSVSITHPAEMEWLRISGQFGELQVSVEPMSLPPDAYMGTIFILAEGEQFVQAVSVRLNVSDLFPPEEPILTSAPEALEFTHRIGSPAPAAKSVLLTTSLPDGLNLTLNAATADEGGWLSVTPQSGATPLTASVMIHPAGLTPGEYNGVVAAEFISEGGIFSYSVPVTLVVLPPSQISAAPTSLAFDYVLGSAPPPARTIAVSSASPVTVTVTLSGFSFGLFQTWMTVTPLQAATPATLNAALNPSALGALSAGSYSGTIVIRTQDSSDEIAVPVTLTVRDGVLSLTGLPPSTGGGVQLPFALVSSNPVGAAVSGTLNLSFTPQPLTPCAAQPCDQTPGFAAGGRSLSFTIPQGQTAAVFSGGVPVVTTGTTAGPIQLAAQIGDAPPIPMHTLQVALAPPVISSVEIVNIPGGIEVRVSGFSTSREITGAGFQFQPRPGGRLRSTQVPVAVGPAFASWYQSPASAPLGSAFLYVQQFSIQGDPGVLASLRVTLTNSQGSSTSSPVPFP